MASKQNPKVEVIRFKYDVPLKETMAFESVYHPNLQYTYREKQELRKIPGALFVWMFVDDALAGESYGIPMAHLDGPVEGLSKLSQRQKEAGIYCYSNTILPLFQERGLGTVLKAHWLGLAAGRGFEVVFGHARPGGSQALNAKFGAVFLQDFPDWAGTGEAYKLYRIMLDPFEGPEKTLSPFIIGA